MANYTFIILEKSILPGNTAYNINQMLITKSHLN